VYKRQHQDGALRFDFIANGERPPRGEDLLAMCTCWIALTPCGADAPGLEWIETPQPRLLRPAELQPKSVAARHKASLLRRPILAPGDALLFDGRLLHRTHLLASMAGMRTSIELRFFGAPLPARVASDRHIALASQGLPEWPAAMRGMERTPG
jgi:ectoine hydroxylase-related dioxygenase (phytanoyl-CoA dioxygenase family)